MVEGKGLGHNEASGPHSHLGNFPSFPPSHEGKSHLNNSARLPTTEIVGSQPQEFPRLSLKLVPVPRGQGEWGKRGGTPAPQVAGWGARGLAYEATRPRSGTQLSSRFCAVKL